MIGLPPKVSIIIPIYNAAQYLEKCIFSCIQQTLFDIEIICVNDGSTDDSQIIVDKLSALDYRISSIIKPNGGLSSARNAGIEASTGSIIMFLDSDDYLEKNTCEKLWIEFRECAPDIIGFGTEIFPIMPHASNWMYDRLSAVSNNRYWKFEPRALFMENGAHPFVWRNAFSREFLNKYTLRFDEQIKFGEDSVFQLEAYPHASRICFISDHLYHYRWFREGSMMEKALQNPAKKLDYHIEIIDHISAYWQHNDWFEEYATWFLDWALDFVIPDLNKLQPEEANAYYRKLYDLFTKYQPQKYVYQPMTPARANCWAQIQLSSTK